MAAVTGPGNEDAPQQPRKRRWLTWLVVAWIMVVAGLGAWSVRNDPATVPDQRDIVLAVGDLQRAAGVVFAAAGGGGHAEVLDALELVPGCRVTSVRRGVTADRDVVVQVREGDARAALDEIAAGLPDSYDAHVDASKTGTRVRLHADAGNFVGIDSDALATAKVVTVRVSSGCRPRGDHDPDEADPAAGPAPAVLGQVVTALGGAASQPAVQAVGCPDGGVAATYRVDGVATPSDLDARMRSLSADQQIVRSDASAWVYRTGDTAVVVVPDGDRLRVSVSTSC